MGFGGDAVSQTILFKEECYRIVGAAFEVFNELGNGFLEPVYQEALEIEFASQGIPFVPQQPLRITYKRQQLLKEYCADFVCFGMIIVEIKALPKLSGREDAQLMNYLKATGFRLGLLINFGTPNKLDWNRVVW